MTPITKLILLALVLVLAHTTETVLGFGCTLIAMALGIYLFPLHVILPVLVVLGLLQSIWLVGRWFRHIQWRVLLFRILPSTALGMAVGIHYRTQVADYKQLIILLGIFIMAASLMEVVLIYKTRAVGSSLPWYLAIPILIVGGIFHGIFATGGPMIIYYAGRELKEPAEFRATVSTLWLVLNSALVVNLYSIGQLNLETLTMTGMVLPGFILGIVLGSRVKFRAIVFKVLIYMLLFFAGLILLFQP